MNNVLLILWMAMCCAISALSAVGGDDIWLARLVDDYFGSYAAGTAQSSYADCCLPTALEEMTWAVGDDFTVDAVQSAGTIDCSPPALGETAWSVGADCVTESAPPQGRIDTGCASQNPSSFFIVPKYYQSYDEGMRYMTEDWRIVCVYLKHAPKVDRNNPIEYGVEEQSFLCQNLSAKEQLVQKYTVTYSLIFRWDLSIFFNHNGIRFVQKEGGDTIAESALSIKGGDLVQQSLCMMDKTIAQGVESFGYKPDLCKFTFETNDKKQIDLDWTLEEDQIVLSCSTQSCPLAVFAKKYSLRGSAYKHSNFIRLKAPELKDYKISQAMISAIDCTGIVLQHTGGSGDAWKLTYSVKKGMGTLVQKFGQKNIYSARFHYYLEKKGEVDIHLGDCHAILAFAEPEEEVNCCSLQIFRHYKHAKILDFQYVFPCDMPILPAHVCAYYKANSIEVVMLTTGGVLRIFGEEPDYSRLHFDFMKNFSVDNTQRLFSYTVTETIFHGVIPSIDTGSASQNPFFFIAPKYYKSYKKGMRYMTKDWRIVCVYLSLASKVDRNNFIEYGVEEQSLLCQTSSLQEQLVQKYIVTHFVCHNWELSIFFNHNGMRFIQKEEGVTMAESVLLIKDGNLVHQSRGMVDTPIAQGVESFGYKPDLCKFAFETNDKKQISVDWILEEDEIVLSCSIRSCPLAVFAKKHSPPGNLYKLSNFIRLKTPDLKGYRISKAIIRSQGRDHRIILQHTSGSGDVWQLSYYSDKGVSSFVKKHGRKDIYRARFHHYLEAKGDIDIYLGDLHTTLAFEAPAKEKKCCSLEVWRHHKGARIMDLRYIFPCDVPVLPAHVSAYYKENSIEVMMLTAGGFLRIFSAEQDYTKLHFDFMKNFSVDNTQRLFSYPITQNFCQGVMPSDVTISQVPRYALLPLID